eukprot:scaffold44161_cov78-Phaeocystis_antarctica.AAC.7
MKVLLLLTMLLALSTKVAAAKKKSKAQIHKERCEAPRGVAKSKPPTQTPAQLRYLKASGDYHNMLTRTASKLDDSPFHDLFKKQIVIKTRTAEDMKHDIEELNGKLEDLKAAMVTVKEVFEAYLSVKEDTRRDPTEPLPGCGDGLPTPNGLPAGDARQGGDGKGPCHGLPIEVPGLWFKTDPRFALTDAQLIKLCCGIIGYATPRQGLICAESVTMGIAGFHFKEAYVTDETPGCCDDRRAVCVSQHGDSGCRGACVREGRGIWVKSREAIGVRCEITTTTTMVGIGFGFVLPRPPRVLDALNLIL